MKPNHPTISLDDLKRRIQEEARRFDDVIRLELAQITNGADALLMEILEYALLGGGKRIRPLLAVLSSSLCGRVDDNAYRLGCGFEFLHVATLVHDDIIDSSLKRRGRDAVHRKYGTVPAILAGDFLHAAAMALVGENAGQKGLRVFCRATTGMVEGEFMQLRNARNCNLSESDYYHAIMHKTGLLISAACEVGAMYGGGTTEQIEALRRYGEHLGCAFQIIDDLLDYQGSEKETGKQLGNDLFEGKMTLPLILALERCSGAESERLHKVLGSGERSPERFQEVAELIDSKDGFNLAKEQARKEVDAGLECLALFHGNSQQKARETLEWLLQYVLLRQQ